MDVGRMTLAEQRSRIGRAKNGGEQTELSQIPIKLDVFLTSAGISQ